MRRTLAALVLSTAMGFSVAVAAHVTLAGEPQGITRQDQTQMRQLLEMTKPKRKSTVIDKNDQRKLDWLFKKVTPKPDMNKFREPKKVEWEI